MKFLKLIRYKNLLIIILIQCLLQYVFIDHMYLVINSHQPANSSIFFSQNLTHLQFIILITATLLIASAGYIINDIYDLEGDLINKPNKVVINNGISENLAFNLYMLFTVLGVGLGLYLSWQVNKHNFAILFLIISAGLYFYSTSLKQVALIGNIIVSIILGLSVIIVGIFEIIPFITLETQGNYLEVFKYLSFYAVFAFALNLVRELVKDIEDIDGDYKSGHKTLPIILGRKRSMYVALLLLVITILGIFFYAQAYLFENKILLFYFIFLIIGPLLFCCIKLINAKQKSHYSKISTILKVTMLLGILSILLLKY